MRIGIKNQSDKNVFIIALFLLLKGANLLESDTNEIVFDSGAVDSNEEVTNTKYTIKNKGCTIPQVNLTPDIPWEHESHEFVPCNKISYPLLQKNKTHIWVISKNLNYYHVYNNTHFQCCYRAIKYLPHKKLYTKAWFKNSKKGKCSPFSTSIKAIDEFVRVTCRREGIDIYEQIYVFVIQKPFTDQRPQPFSILPDSLYNVVILGLSSVSRLNFHRSMKRTSGFMKNKEAIELWGYSRVGSTAFQNMVPVLVGMSAVEMNAICWPSAQTALDHCPYIWERFKDSGFYTALIEDSMKYGIFQSKQLALKPTDYYLNPFYNSSQLEDQFGVSSCLDYEYYRISLNYIQGVISLLQSFKLFALFWESAILGHKKLNLPFLIDKDYEVLMKTLDSSGALNDSVLILLSDRGVKYDDFEFTNDFNLEENLPIASILVPPSFSEKYPLAYENLKNNRHRLSTPYDMHETLVDLINLSSISNEEIWNRCNTPYLTRRGISLFMPIPGNRTCEAAGIDWHWCHCVESD